MELADLVGKHYLSGVDMNTESIKKYDEYFEDCQVINFVLDGKTYTAIEDPKDGYRSCMNEIKETDVKVTNKFEPQLVLAVMSENTSHNLLELFDEKTGKSVLCIGTVDIDDYYPCFIAEFAPENMGINLKGDK